MTRMHVYYVVQNYNWCGCSTPSHLGAKFDYFDYFNYFNSKFFCKTSYNGPYRLDGFNLEITISRSFGIWTNQKCFINFKNLSSTCEVAWQFSSSATMLILKFNYLCADFWRELCWAGKSYTSYISFPCAESCKDVSCLVGRTGKSYTSYISFPCAESLFNKINLHPVLEGEKIFSISNQLLANFFFVQRQ